MRLINKLAIVVFGIICPIAAVWAGSSFTAAGGGNVPLTTKGDILSHDGTSADRLAAGANGLCLVTDSAETLGVRWGSCASGSSPLTTKGDLFTYTTADARLPVGTDGLCLQAASGETTGLIWGTCYTPTFTAASSDTLTNKTIDADGTGNSITNIENADIKAAAGIALSKLAATTASRALVSDGSGFVSASSVTATTLGYLDATSSVQTQLNGKLSSTPVEMICGHMESPANSTYYLVLDSAYSFTVTSITTDIGSGSLTLAVQDDGVSLTSCSAISVTTTETNTDCADTVISANADLTLVISSGSSPVDFRFCVKTTRD